MTNGPAEPLLPDTTSDESDRGWGADLGGTAAGPGPDDPDDLERFLREVPPHHGG
jgi:hypothetical protein